MAMQKRYRSVGDGDGAMVSIVSCLYFFGFFILGSALSAQMCCRGQAEILYVLMSVWMLQVDAAEVDLWCCSNLQASRRLGIGFLNRGIPCSLDAQSDACAVEE